MECIKPKVSIVTPLYNAQKHIEQTAKSILAQSFMDFEWIIVDDGSIDESLKILKSFNDERIRIITQENAGAATARNNGIANANADIISFIDSDDLWHKDKLKVDYETFINSKYEKKVLISGYYMFQDEDVFHLSPKCSFDGKITSINRFYPHLFNPGVMMLDKSILDEVGAFDTSWYYHEDYSLAIKLVEEYPIISSPQRLMYYRYYIDSKGTKCLDNFEYKNSYATILEKYFETSTKEYDKDFKQKAYDICYKTEIFLLLSLKNNIEMAKKVYKEKIENKKAFGFSIRGLFILLSLYTGINFIMPIRKFIQKFYLFYFRHINKIRVFN